MNTGQPPGYIIKQQKEAIRSQMRTRRGSIPSNGRATAADALCKYVDALGLAPGCTVACYWALGTEMDMAPLLRQLHKQGYVTALARTVAPMASLRFFRWAPGMQLVSDILGFPTPPDTEEVQPDVVMIPLLAFDDAGYRLGQGAGFYDRTLQRLRGEPGGEKIKMIGIAFACQRADALPVEPHDERLDMILTETGIIVSRPHAEQVAS